MCDSRIRLRTVNSEMEVSSKPTSLVFFFSLEFNFLVENFHFLKHDGVRVFVAELKKCISLEAQTNERHSWFNGLLRRVVF